MSDNRVVTKEKKEKKKDEEKSKEHKKKKDSEKENIIDKNLEVNENPNGINILAKTFFINYDAYTFSLKFLINFILPLLC